MTLSPPIAYRADLEQVESDEAETITELNATFDTILETTAEDGGHAIRAVHAKAHAILEGTLTIDAGLSPELTQGLFATPGEHRVVLRISTTPGDILDDAISVPRGLAMKVFDVDGARLPGAEGAAQDFVLINGKTFQTKTADKFLGNLKMLAKTTDRAEGTKKALSAVLRGVSSALGAVGMESAAIQSLGGAPNVHPLGQTYYSVTPFRYGDFVAKFSLKPVEAVLGAFEDAVIDPAGNPDAVRDTMQQDMRVVDGEWEFCVQLCRDVERQPIEDPTIEWKEDEAPFQRVGIVRAAAQDSWSADKVRAVDDESRFSVWTGLAAHQPLGNINRARRETYDHSADFRAAFNRCPIHEPA